MIKSIHKREVIAWMTLVIAIILFSASLAFAQTKTVNIDSNNGKAHVKISKTENGKTTTIDTTFEVNDDTDIDQIVHELSGDEQDEKIIVKKRMKHRQADSDSKSSSKAVKSHKKNTVVIDVDNNFSEKDMKQLREDLRQSMKDMRNGLEEMDHSLKSLSLHFDGDEDFSFELDIPEIRFDGDVKCRAYAYSFSDVPEELDSLDDEDHIVIVGDEGEKAPVLEKVVTGKNGKQIFVYKRESNNKEEKQSVSKSSDLGISDLEYFPNPTSGKVTVKFDAEKESDYTIRIVDESGKEVFSEQMKNFKGEYSKEIDLSTHSKGNYILKISSGKKAVSKKIVLN